MNIKRLGFLSTSLFLVIILFLNNSCKHDEIPANKFDPVPFTEVQQIFTDYCVKCHGGSGNGNESGLDFRKIDGIYKTVTAGNASKSKSYQSMISTIQMMPPDIAVPTNKRTLFRIWIEQGANNP